MRFVSLLLLLSSASADPCEPASAQPVSEMRIVLAQASDATTSSNTSSAGNAQAADDPKAHLPVPAGTRITSNYGWRTHPISGKRKMHNGTDFGMARGASVYATGNGTIVYSGWAGGFGHHVQVELTDGTKVTYSHLKDRAGMEVGDSVTPGQVVGHINSSGSSTGDHLHLEVWNSDGVRVNPRTFFGL